MNNLDKNVYAKIHSFETFGTVDGPGIRFIIFMQGCNLQCKYCQNRDTWDICKGKYVYIDEIINKIYRYKNYIMPSGGVTISGGEPLLQPNFLINLLKELKKEKIHVAIDTAGVIDLNEKIKEVINLTDLFLLDIKSINEDVCKNLIGVSNKKEIEFARYLSLIDKDVWIRQVLVPGITDREEDLEKLKDFLMELNNIKKIEILPYHDMGKYKWEELGCKYDLEKIRTANDDDIYRAKKILRNSVISF